MFRVVRALDRVQSASSGDCWWRSLSFNVVVCGLARESNNRAHEWCKSPHPRWMDIKVFPPSADARIAAKTSHTADNPARAAVSIGVSPACIPQSALQSRIHST